MSDTAVVETNGQEAGVQRATSGPARLVQFLKDTRLELNKVVTPTRAEVQSTTIVVVATVFIFAAYFALIDAVVGKGVDKFFIWATKH